MTLSGKYKLSAEITNKVRREKRLKPSPAVPARLQYLLHEQVEPEEFFSGVGQAQDSDIPFWWERAIPLSLSKREHKKEVAKQAQINRELKQQQEAIKKASLAYITKIHDAEQEFAQRVKRNEELIALKRQELKNLQKRQEEEYKHAFYELELQLQKERQARQANQLQAQGLKSTEELKQELAKREHQFAEKLARLTDEVEALKAENLLIEQEISLYAENKGLSAEFISFTKNGLTYRVRAEENSEAKPAEQAIRIAYGARVKVAEKKIEEPKAKERIVIPKDDKWYSDSQYVPYKKDYQRINYDNVFEVKDLRVYDQNNYAWLSYINFFLRDKEKSVIFGAREDQVAILADAIMGSLQQGFYMPSGTIDIFGQAANEGIGGCPNIGSLQEKLKFINNINKKTLKAGLPKKLLNQSLQSMLLAFGIELQPLLKTNVKKISNTEKQALALCLTLQDKGEITILAEPTAYLGHRQREALLEIINTSPSSMLILTSDEVLAANIKQAYTFTI